MNNYNYDGPLRPNTLIPLYGNSYDVLKEFSEILKLANDWQYKSMSAKLIEFRKDNMISQYTRDISLMLEAEILLSSGYFSEALIIMDQFLAKYPEDIQALFLSACASYKIENFEAFDQFAYQLKLNSQFYHEELMRILILVRDNQTRNDFYLSEDNVHSIDAVILYGNRMEEDGSMSRALEMRLNEAKRILKKNTKALLLASGGAAVTPFSEADAMKEWLNKNGIEKERVFMDEDAKDTVGNNFGYQKLMNEYNLDLRNFCVVSSLSHLPRVWMSFTESMISFKRPYDNIYASSPEPAGSIEIPADEIDYGLFTVLKSGKLFERKDFGNI